MRTSRLFASWFLTLVLSLAPLPSWAGTCQAGNANDNLPVLQPTVDFTDNLDGTVTHNKTGLMWKRCAEGQTWNGTTCTGTASTQNWSASLTLARNSSYASHTDWRLPNIKELMSIAETCGYNPSLNASIFPNAAVSHPFWSSTLSSGTEAHIADLSVATFNPFTITWNNSYALLVRDGPALDTFDLLTSDAAPDAFSFTPQTNVALSTVTTSNTITVSGINYTAPVSVTGGQYSINGGGYSTAVGFVWNGDTVTVRQTSSASTSTTTTATLTIGGVSGNFSVTTTAVPPTPPSAPTIVVGTPGNTQISVAFTGSSSPGTLPGGAPATITQYTATCGTQNNTGAGSPIVVSGLTNGTAYTCTVKATNGVPLDSADSLPSSGVTPRTVPDAPTIGTATPGSASASVAFTANGNGGAAIDNFRVTCNPGSISATGAASPINVTGLTNGTSYACTAAAHNAAGWSTESATASVLPSSRSYTAPSATGTGSITASFTGGGAGCTYTTAQYIPLTGHPASPPAGSAPSGVNFPHGLFDFVLTNCTPGSTVNFTVAYPQALPAGTQYWKYGPTAANTIPHWYVLPASISGNQASFSITDGGLGDDDLAANGSIVDQGGPGNQNIGTVPTLSTWALGLLALLLGMMGALRRRVR